MEKDRGLEKAEGWKIRRLEGWKDRCVAKTRKERGRGFKGSSGERQRIRWLEGWRFSENS